MPSPNPAVADDDDVMVLFCALLDSLRVSYHTSMVWYHTPQVRAWYEYENAAVPGSMVFRQQYER